MLGECEVCLYAILLAFKPKLKYNNLLLSKVGPTGSNSRCIAHCWLFLYLFTTTFLGDGSNSVVSL